MPDPKHGQRQLRITASLWDGVAALQGVTLRFACSSEGFDLPTHISLLVEYRGKPRAAARIDINGGPHPNSHAVCQDLQFLDAGKTHFHDTRLHLGIPIDRLFSGEWDLPVARPISDMPQDFSKAMEKCGELLHIGNMTEIEEPQWQPRQFPF
jgi:hypothetical protein